MDRESIILNSRIGLSYPELITKWRTVCFLSEEGAHVETRATSIGSFNSFNEAIDSIELDENSCYVVPENFDPVYKYQDAIKIVRLLSSKGFDIEITVESSEGQSFVEVDIDDGKSNFSSGAIEDLSRLICLAALELEKEGNSTKN